MIVTLTPNPSVDRTLFPRVDDRIPVHVTATDPNVALREPATP